MVAGVRIETRVTAELARVDEYTRSQVVAPTWGDLNRAC